MKKKPAMKMKKAPAKLMKKSPAKKDEGLKALAARSEERRVGKECRSRGSP